MTVALSIEGLSYSYRGDWLVSLKRAVTNLSLEVEAGECFGFLGHNGAGKTTTIKCILDLVRPSSGRISIFGQSSANPGARSVIGYVPEQPYFYDYLTVREIMQMYATLSGLSRKNVREEAVFEALDSVNMSGRADQRMNSLSKGLVQRVAIAQAIVAKPKLLILDEPFSGMDPIGRKEFRDLFMRLKAEGTTIFMCSHILSDVEYLCDRVSILARGELKGVFDLRSRDHFGSGWYEIEFPWSEVNQRALQEIEGERVIKTDSRSRIGLIKIKSRQTAERALELALKSGIEIRSYNYEHGSLEDLFVTLVRAGES